MGKWLQISAVLALTMIAVASAQEEAVEWRLEHIAGVQPDAAKAFFAALQKSLASGDRRAVCARVEYPLRRAIGSVRSASACHTQYTQIFTKDVLDAVAAQRFDQLFVNSGGIMVGNGQLWFSGLCRDDTCGQVDIRVIAVNNERDFLKSVSPPKGQVLLSCRADGMRIEIVADARGGRQYRGWRRGRSATAPPDLEIARGTEAVEGSAGCAHRTWSFRNATIRLSVSELGCFPVSSSPPRGAIGQFVMDPDSPAEKVSWCF